MVMGSLAGVLHMVQHRAADAYGMRMACCAVHGVVHEHAATPCKIQSQLLASHDIKEATLAMSSRTYTLLAALLGWEYMQHLSIVLKLAS